MKGLGTSTGRTDFTNFPAGKIILKKCYPVVQFVLIKAHFFFCRKPEESPSFSFPIFVQTEPSNTISMKKLILLTLALAMMFSCSYGGNNEKDDLVSYLSSRVNALNSTGDLEQMLTRAGERKLVLMGEASHGTREYYAWRDSLSRRLIADHGFNFIAVEGDWASLYELNRYVKDMPGAASSAREVLEQLDRWPQWMWGNEQVVALAEWLRSHNDNLPMEEKAGFYGKDVYDEWRSKDAVLDFVRKHDTDTYETAKDYLDCFAPYDGDSWNYAQDVIRTGEDCTSETSALVELIRESRDRLDQADDYAYFYSLQNALVIKHAEKFYRKSATRRDASAWNARVSYMDQTVNNLLEWYGEDSQGIVWAHNTHIGDARFTEMQNRGQKNIGQLTRVDHGPESVFLIGFGTYEGTVKAGSEWDSPRQKMTIPEARHHSIERVFKDTGMEQLFIIFDDEDRTHDLFMEPIGNRAVGVVYNPRNDMHQFVMTIVPLRYDAFIFFRETEALDPIHP